MQTNDWLKRGVLSLALLGAVLLTACPAAKNQPATSSRATDHPAEQPRAGTKQPLSAEQLLEQSWLKNTPYETTAPLMVMMNASGTAMFMQGTVGPGLNEAVQLPLVDGKLGRPVQVYTGQDFNRTYIWGHPEQAEILMITNYQAEGGPVIDLVWQAKNKARRGVPYNNEPNLPQDTPADTFYGLDPVYSWDGATIIVPLRYAGLCLVDAKTGATNYVKYPAYDFKADAIVVQPLPDANGRRLAYLSMYHQSWPQDDCLFALLDLDSREWVFTLDLPWVIYQAGGSDPLNLPLLVAGSRPTEINTETKRQARIALIDTASGTQKLLQFFGQPVWYTALDPFGECVVYMDSLEKALVKLSPADGKLELDRRIYDEEAKLFCGPHGENVMIWNRSLLLPAEWNDSKQVQGYLDE